MVSVTTKAAVAVVLLFATTAYVQAQQVSVLPNACIQNRTLGCCPALIDLLEAEQNGCTVSSITDAADSAAATTMCDSCGAKFSAIAKVTAGVTGPACAIVQKHVSLFPFACKSREVAGNCLVAVREVMLGNVDVASAVATDGFCGAYSCYGEFLRHMRTAEYDVQGVAVNDYVQRIGGVNNLLLCAQVGGDSCFDEIQAYSTSMNMPSQLQDVVLDESAAFCSGCDRIAFSNALAQMSSVNLQYDAESYRRLALGGCAGGCSASWRNMTPGRRAFLDIAPPSWGACSTLYEASPSCSSECNNFGQDMIDEFGCCARFALESATVSINRRASPASAIPGNGASVGSFVSLFNTYCSANLMDDCDHDFAATSTPAMVEAEKFTDSTQLSSAPTDNNVFAQAFAARIGVLTEDVAFDSVRDGDKLDFKVASRSVAGNAEAGDAYTSIATSGGMALEAPNQLVMDPACPPTDEVLPNYGYVPDVGFVTTDCPTLKEVVPTVDCATADYVDQFQTKMWIVDTLNARSCSA